MKVKKKSLGNKLKYYLSWCCMAKSWEERVKKALVIFFSLVVVLVLSIVFHNFWYAIFGSEDIVFFFLTLSIGFILPFYFLYTLVVLIVFLVRKVLR